MQQLNRNELHTMITGATVLASGGGYALGIQTIDRWLAG